MLRPNDNDKIAWRPIPGTSQELALDTRANRILFDGTRGPGKTDTQLMRFCRFVGAGYGAYWRGIIFDREYKNLDDLVSKSRRWFPRFGDGAKFQSSKSDFKWAWPTGEELLFRTIKKPEDYWNYHGQEFPYIGWNELCKWPTAELFEMMLSCNRSSFVPDVHTPYDEDENGRRVYQTHDGKPLPKIPLEIFATTNSLGPGHVWVKDEFVAGKTPGKLYRTKTEIFNPRTQREEIVVTSSVRIKGSWRENPYLDPVYIAGLTNERDPNRRASWLDGSWDIAVGGAFEGAWDERVNIVPRFVVPAGWHIDRALDWGSSHPFSVGWFAEANGEEAILPDGSTFCPPRGSLVQIFELYGSAKVGTNRGYRWPASTIAEKIKEVEINLMRNGWIVRQPTAGPADNEIRNVRNSEDETIEQRMLAKDIRWEHSDKSPGSRKNGLQLMRDMHIAAIDQKDEPHLYYMQNCVASTTTIPILPLDETKLDDVDTTAEDHAYDMVRYRVLKGSNRSANVIHVNFPI